VRRLMAMGRRRSVPAKKKKAAKKKSAAGAGRNGRAALARRIKISVRNRRAREAAGGPPLTEPELRA
jgi:hypothetical protein